MTNKITAARAALHMWEEPCISGTNGSGTVFFSGCPLGCIFCQNRPIALGKSGSEITIEELSAIFLKLKDQGAHNINLVTPTHFVPSIVEAVAMSRQRGLDLPIVYNTGSYEQVETVRMLADTVDIFLPDLKFYENDTADRYAKAPDYFEVATAAIAEMVRLAGPPIFENGLMKRGVIVRHLIMPGHTKGAIAILEHLKERFGDSIFISLMNQYTPMPGIESHFPELGRTLTKREYAKVMKAALDMGITNAFYQEGSTVGESFIPAFDGKGITHE
ncbi:MAG: radical SAM protein [Lachnospiraceae bacterium]|nr:radical SAM protein [Lachnospiraceae bacterium]